MKRPIVNITPECSAEGGVIENEQLPRDVDYFFGITYGEAVRFEKPTPAPLWVGLKQVTTKGKFFNGVQKIHFFK